MNNGKFFAGLALGALVGQCIKLFCAQQQRSQIEKRRV